MEAFDFFVPALFVGGMVVYLAYKIGQKYGWF